MADHAREKEDAQLLHIQQLQQRLAAAEGLRDYVQHKSGCAGPCDCGGQFRSLRYDIVCPRCDEGRACTCGLSTRLAASSEGT